MYGVVLAACRKRGIYPGIHCGEPAYAARMIRMGFRLTTIANDSGLMAKARARRSRAFGKGSASSDRQSKDAAVRMRWHRRSRRKASLTERARCYACPGGTTPQRYPAGLLPCFFRLIIGGRSAPSSAGSRANLAAAPDFWTAG